MADTTTLIPTMGMGGGDGMFGGMGGGGGLIGGLLLGTLLRGGNGLFGGNGYGAGGALVGGEMAMAAAGANPFQQQANMSIMSTLGDIKQSVAVSTANMETSQALQSSTIQAQLNSVASSLSNNVAGVKDVVNGNSVALMNMINGVEKSGAANTVTLMSQFNGLDKSLAAGFGAVINQINGVDKSISAVERSVTNDGEKTRALIVQQYEASLNRQLQEANAAVIELRSQNQLAAASRGIEVTTTNNINQAQAQQQQQQQFNALAGLVSSLANDLQYIRASNQAINIGAGTQTANPSNTTSNVRA